MPNDAADAPRLVCGPLLRYADTSRATIWVETDRACVVEVLGVREPTWSVHGHHYALVLLEDLPAGAETPYEVHLDGAQVWPEPGSGFPPSVIRTFRKDSTFRLSFGSCRRSAPFDADGIKRFGADALAALAGRMRTLPYEEWPDALFLDGDQVYADEPSDALRARLREKHAGDDDGLGEEIRDYEEYTWLYEETWNIAPVRWLLSTVPTCMLLDDHDLRDDWNTSLAWRQEVTAQPWWRKRVTGALASYWVYQHLGNLSPEQLTDDPTFAMVREVDDDAERTERLDAFAWDADATAGTTRWSYYRDFGDEGIAIRMIAVDARCSRRLEEPREMVDDAEWDWIVDHALADKDGRPFDHVLLGTTLPVFMLHAIHHLEGWNEAVCRGAWGKLASRVGEKIRQGVDLEHWAAFRTSFERVVELLRRLTSLERPPASVLFLSGDVHCSYAATVRPDGVDDAVTAVHQLTMSPFRNPLDIRIRTANRLAETRFMGGLWHRLAKLAGVRDVGVNWDVDAGPWFDNGVMTVVLHGRKASYEIDHAEVEGGRVDLRRTRAETLTKA